MTSNYSRYALWIVLGFALWLNYQAWHKDYAAVDAAARRRRRPSACRRPRQRDSAVRQRPVRPAWPAAAGSSAARRRSGARDRTGGRRLAGRRRQRRGGPAVHVHTDVLDLDISLTGGTITQADLNEYTRIKGQPQPVRLENHDSPETLYLLQVAMTGPRGQRAPDTSRRPSPAASPIS